MHPRYFDAHCHVQLEAYDEDRDALLARMRGAGVAALVVGVDHTTSKRAVALADHAPHLRAAIGLHPNHALEERFDASSYETLARLPSVVAIGECGLDYYRPTALTGEMRAAQETLLRAHLELAARVEKPLIIHARPSKGMQDAYHDLIRLLREYKKTAPNLRGDVHFFVGGIEEARALIALDFTVSFTAVITFARDYDSVIRALPLEGILSETDAPYVAPLGRRGKRNDPLAVQDVVERIALIRGEDPETVRAAIFTNAQKLFPHLRAP